MNLHFISEPVSYYNHIASGVRLSVRPSVNVLGVPQVFSGMVRWNLIKLGIVVVVYVLLMHVILFLKWGHSMPLGQVVKGQNCTIS